MPVRTNSVSKNILIGVVEPADGVGGMSSAATIVSSCKNNRSGFDAVVQNSQVASSAVSLLSMHQGVRNFIPLVNSQAGFFSGFVTLLNVGVKIVDGDPRTSPTLADFASAIGSFSGVSLSLGMAIGSTPLVAASAVVMIAASIYQLFSDGAQQDIQDCLVSMYDKYYVGNPSASYNRSFLSSEFSIASMDEIDAVYGGKVAALGWDNYSGRIFQTGVSKQGYKNMFGFGLEGEGDSKDSLECERPKDDEEENGKGGGGGAGDFGHEEGRTIHEDLIDFEREPNEKITVEPLIPVPPEDKDCSSVLDCLGSIEGAPPCCLKPNFK